mmetsp:Transcript_20611/g.42775  ORF Transcript_20611/g.42775 Transcript_20611/m.42775 type:complete len:227 (-) Transcript_20611:171-851(-)
MSSTATSSPTSAGKRQPRAWATCPTSQSAPRFVELPLQGLGGPPRSPRPRAPPSGGSRMMRGRRRPLQRRAVRALACRGARSESSTWRSRRTCRDRARTRCWASGRRAAAPAAAPAAARRARGARRRTGSTLAAAARSLREDPRREVPCASNLGSPGGPGGQSHHPCHFCDKRPEHPELCLFPSPVRSTWQRHAAGARGSETRRSGDDTHAQFQWHPGDRVMWHFS